MSEIADRYRTLSSAFARKVDAVEPKGWSAPSPCEGWTAGDLVGHVVSVHGMMLALIGRQLSPAPAATEDPAAAFAAARADVEAVLDDPALAATMHDGAFGQARIDETFDRFLGFDLVVHGWDLARATGQDEAIDPAEVSRIWTMAEGFGDNLRRSGVCGPAVAVPDDAPLQDRLLGLLGRDPVGSA
jgi:uncharacterized protein (TIGR03086 family)